MNALYDTIGRGYANYRKPDPRIAALILDALGDARSVVNVGAGAGSYEPCGLDVVAVEPCVTMIAQRPPHAARVIQASAENLPFPDKSFDAYTIAFGIRNVTHIDKALTEAHRVLKPGGKFQCLEFSHVDVPGLEQIYDAYSFTAIPAIGKVVTGDGAAYRYLVESIRTFPDQERFEAMIRQAGFSHVGHRSLTGGIVAIHWGWRI